MQLRGRYEIWLLTAIIFFTSNVLAASPKLGEIKPGEYTLIPIINHLPYAARSSGEYWESLQKVDLELGNQEQFHDLPELGMKHPYTGVIKLGDKSQKFGVIVDVMAEEKRLYIDADGDGSFANEPWIELLNEWYGPYAWNAAHAYWITGPEPIRLKVSYDTKSAQSYEIEISVFGLLNRPGPINEGKPFLLIAVRTWFLAKISEDGYEKLVAIVDQNNNGKYNDPEDRLFIDYNDDGYFSKEEAIPRKRGVKIESGKLKFSIDWRVYPEKLIIN